MAKYPGGVALSGYAAPSDTADIYATHKAQFGYGGYRSALDLTARDAITTLRREEGMVVYVISEKKEYRLVGGTANTNWEEVVSATGGGGTADANYIIVASLDGLASVPTAIRKVGLLVYIADIDMEYRLVHGITDADWVEVSLQNGYIILQNINDLNSLPEPKRKVGLLAYVIQTNSEYRLVGGILNENWTQISGEITIGNYLVVENITERDTIPTNLRKVGQICYINSIDTEYRLVGGIANTNWVALANNIGSGSGDTNYVIVDTLADVEGYPIADRRIGMIIYAKDLDKEFRFVHGITNSDLKEINSNVINTEGDVTNNITNNYYNTFGCLNLAAIYDAIDEALDGFKPIYKDPDQVEVPSENDKNEFSFRINRSEFWVEDWIYFTGSTNIVSGKVCEVFIEFTQNGNTEIINVSDILKNNISMEYIQLNGTLSSWSGYFKKTTPGRVDIKAYETQDGLSAFNINKSVYLFTPNFSIKDGTSNTPKDIIFSSSIYSDKVYDIDVVANSLLTLVLARVNVGNRGIDTTSYTTVTSTMATINSDGTFTIPAAAFRNITNGNYAILVTGKDGSVAIPPYFYGPFIVNLNGSTIANTSISTSPVSGTGIVPLVGSIYVEAPSANPATLTQFLNILNSIYGNTTTATKINTIISSTDLSGLNSSNLNSYVDLIYSQI